MLSKVNAPPCPRCQSPMIDRDQDGDYSCFYCGCMVINPQVTKRDDSHGWYANSLAATPTQYERSMLHWDRNDVRR